MFTNIEFVTIDGEELYLEKVVECEVILSDGSHTTEDMKCVGLLLDGDEVTVVFQSAPFDERLTTENMHTFPASMLSEKKRYKSSKKIY